MRSETNTSINKWPSTRSTHVAHSMHMRDERLRNAANSMEIYGNEIRNQHVDKHVAIDKKHKCCT